MYNGPIPSFFIIQKTAKAFILFNTNIYQYKKKKKRNQGGNLWPLTWPLGPRPNLSSKSTIKKPTILFQAQKTLWSTIMLPLGCFGTFLFAIAPSTYLFIYFIVLIKFAFNYTLQIQMSNVYT